MRHPLFFLIKSQIVINEIVFTHRPDLRPPQRFTLWQDLRLLQDLDPGVGLVQLQAAEGTCP